MTFLCPCGAGKAIYWPGDDTPGFRESAELRVECDDCVRKGVELVNASAHPYPPDFARCHAQFHGYMIELFMSMYPVKPDLEPNYYDRELAYLVETG